MKTAHQIMQHLYNTPQFSKLKRQQRFHLFFQQYFPAFAPKILFFKVEQHTLKIAVCHPAHIKEVKYNQNTIKKYLNSEKALEYLLISKIEHIIVFDPKIAVSRMGKPVKTLNTVYRYCEQANGDFENLATLESIRMHFEQWREIIHRNNRLSQVGDEDNFYQRINE